MFTNGPEAATKRELKNGKDIRIQQKKKRRCRKARAEKGEGREKGRLRNDRAVYPRLTGDKSIRIKRKREGGRKKVASTRGVEKKPALGGAL